MSKYAMNSITEFIENDYYRNHIDNLELSTNITNILESNQEIVSTIDYLFTELDKYSKQLPITDSIVSSIVKYIVELFARLITNFKTIITSFYKAIKRSELQYFIQAHPLVVKRVQSANYLDIIDLQIPTSLFKNKPLINIGNDLYSFYKNFKIKDTSKGIYSLIDVICKNILSSPDVPHEIQSQIDKLKQITNNKYCQSVIKYLVSHISIKQSMLSIPFGKLFKNIRELITIKSTLLSYETDLYNDTMFANTMITKCDKTLDSFEKKITDTLPNIIVSNKSLLKNFADQIHTSAFYFETVGTYAKEVNHFSHYIVEVYKTINESLD